MDHYPMNAEELARSLGLRNGKRLRQVIRENDLMPRHHRGERYEIHADDAARIARDPDAKRLFGGHPL